MDSEFERYEEATVVLAATPAEVFAFVDDHTRLAAHMDRSSWMTGGGRMSVEIDDQHGQSVGSHIRMGGRAFGLRISLDEVVTAHEPPHAKTWETVGQPKLVVIGRYRMGVLILDQGGKSSLQVWIAYDLPRRNRWLGRLFAGAYARWCVRQMASDAQSHFASRKSTQPVS